MPLPDRDSDARGQPRRRFSVMLLLLGGGAALGLGVWLYFRTSGLAGDAHTQAANGVMRANEHENTEARSGGSGDTKDDTTKKAAEIYQRGLAHEAKGELAEARKALEEAAKLGHANALYRCGFYAERGIGGDVNGALARELYEKAGAAGYADAYAAIARMYLQGEVVPADRQLVAQYIEKGLQAGSTEALFLKGVTTLDTDTASAVECISRAADKGSVNAQQLMARLYRDGIGVPKDEQKALEWARLAAANGSADAQVDLAKLLLTSKLFSTPATASAAVSEATDNLLSAEAQNSARATAELLRAAMAKRPQTKEDILNVRQLAMKSFDQGDIQTAFGVAMTYLFTQEDENAKQWLAKGAEAKDWRCAYANALLQSGTSLNEAFGVVARAKYEDYASYRVWQQTEGVADTVAPKPISMKQPVYPAGLDVVGAKGSVTAEFVVDTNGVPTNIKVLDATHPELVKAVSEAIAEWRFTSGIKNGKAVSTRVRVPVYFVPSK